MYNDMYMHMCNKPCPSYCGKGNDNISSSFHHLVGLKVNINTSKYEIQVHVHVLSHTHLLNCFGDCGSIAVLWCR